MQEIWTDMLTYASMVKSNDPNALVCGPEEWGWNGYLYSGYDQQWAGQHGYPSVSTYPDRTANGGWDYMPWLLNHFQQYNTTNHQRLLDYFTLHCYPQEGNVSGNAVDSATELLRNQSTRQFWDTNYTDPSWIDAKIALIPRMEVGLRPIIPAPRSASRNTTGEPNLTSTARPPRLIFLASLEVRILTWPRAGPRLTPAPPLIWR